MYRHRQVTRTTAGVSVDTSYSRLPGRDYWFANLFPLRLRRRR